MRGAILSMLLSAIAASPVGAHEWWHGEFAYDGSKSCFNDSYAKYTDSNVIRHDGYCEILDQSAIEGVDAVRLHMMCAYDDEEPYPTIELLLKIDDERMSTYLTYIDCVDRTKCSFISNMINCSALVDEK